MFDPIISTPFPVTLVGGGDATTDDLHKALKLAPTCVGVDGGAALVQASGVDMSAAIGDFDSIPAEVLANVPPHRRHHIAEQDSTDFEKALSRVSAPMMIGVGFLGGRFDHQLAALHTLQSYPDRPCVLLGPHEVICLAPPVLELPTQADDIVSLFPLAEARGRSSGLEWPIDGLRLAPDGRSGTSNRALGPMTLDIDTPTLLVILPRRLMPQLVTALSQPTAARWPARAQ